MNRKMKVCLLALYSLLSRPDGVQLKLNNVPRSKCSGIDWRQQRRELFEIVSFTLSNNNRNSRLPEGYLFSDQFPHWNGQS
jgi:hypothetical protein